MSWFTNVKLVDNSLILIFVYKFHISDENIEITIINRNLALKKVNSDFIAFLDSDDIWSKNKLKIQLKFMLKNNYKFSYTKYQSFVEGDGRLRKINIPLKNNFINRTKNNL